ncbi:hypothetical protein MRB53_035391 [Persea americana]|uniref:Uncharacterized protein n=1 Tax=Persea americana TaxID=3435 RepID=A0ACC2K4U8_PERAE|nr:hypothetical protein MRB53_035391 [Persea americana]
MISSIVLRPRLNWALGFIPSGWDCLIAPETTSLFFLPLPPSLALSSPSSCYVSPSPLLLPFFDHPISDRQAKTIIISPLSAEATDFPYNSEIEIGCVLYE